MSPWMSCGHTVQQSDLSRDEENPMTSTRNEGSRIKPTLFHAPRHDGLYQPIAFLFVTERMRADILAERATILSALDAGDRKRQAALFGRYDPEVSVRAFNTILDLFHLPHSPATGTDPAPIPTEAVADSAPQAPVEARPLRSRRRQPSPAT